MENTRVKAIEAGFLNYNLRKYLSACLTMEINGEFNVKVKLKGSLSDHWSDPVKWSFRVKTKSENDSIFGMKKISLQSVERRGFIIDKLYQSILGDMGVVNLKIDYINKNFVGVYMVEEFFDSSILTRLKLPLGPILSLIILLIGQL